MRLPFLPLLLLPIFAFAQATPTVKQAPPPGIAVPEADAVELKTELEAQRKDLAALMAKGAEFAKRVLGPERAAQSQKNGVPDVEVFQKAVRYALDYGEFFNPKEIAAAKAQLALGRARIKELQAAQGKPSWMESTGPQVFGYRSRIDDSVQPYGLIVPEDWKPVEMGVRPLYLWFHGRGDTLSEVNFINSRLKAKRDFAPANAFELHLYGRYCNASKFAGETDAFEAMEDAKKRYAIDPNRIVPMGFSMGGATIWHLATHHAGLWAVASGGAGFAETAEYAKVWDPKKEMPPWWEQTLWHLYDATDYAANLSNVPLVAYSGEIDPQKQSGDLMEKICATEGVKLERIIGPNTGHKYEPEAKKEVSKRVDAYMQKGREPLSPHMHLTTYTLRYNQMKWITVDALEKHWERADVDGKIIRDGENSRIELTTKNVAALSVKISPAWSLGTEATLVIDGQTAGKQRVVHTNPPPNASRDTPMNWWNASVEKVNGKWGAIASFQPPSTSSLAKRHGLQGPIDDAFMDSFIFVRPTGKALNEKVGVWSKSEFDRAVTEWRKVFRGDARVVDDTKLTPDDIANSNLVLWGDPGSNATLAKILTKLPLRWTKDQLALGTQKVSAADHAPIMIFPNPLNPQRYVVLNSGFTFRMGAKTSNSLQTPKLPDWAVIDLKTPPNDNWPGQVVDAGFFDEHWQFPAR